MPGRDFNVAEVPICWEPSLSIYASEAFLQTLSSEYGWLGGIDDAGNLRCVLPYSIIKKALFRLVRFPVETIPLGTCLSIEEEGVFLRNVIEHLRETGADSVIPATFNAVFRTFPDGAIAAPFGNYILNLRVSEETLWKNLHVKHRNVIRNAIKKGVRILSGAEHLQTAYELVQDSFRRSAKGPLQRLRVRFKGDPLAFSRQILALKDNVRIFVAEYQGTIQAAAIVPFSNHSAYYMHGGSIDEPLTGSMNLLQWEAIRQFQQLGVSRYDFFGARIAPERGSKMEGIIKFKQRFGGQFVQGYMWKYPFRSINYQLYRIAAGLRNGGDVVDQERHKLSEGMQCLD